MLNEEEVTKLPLTNTLSLEDFYKLVPFDKNDILFLALHGSRINETFSKNSDFDFIMVVSDDLLNVLPKFGVKDDKSLTLKNIDTTVYTEQQFYQEIENNNIKCLETIWLPEEFVWKKVDDVDFKFVLDTKKLRVSVSTISTKAAHYAKILWNREDDQLKAKKNIVHSIRYSLYGLQILEHGKIVNYKCANSYYQQIMTDTSVDWKHYFDTYVQESKRIGKLFRDTISKNR